LGFESVDLKLHERVLDLRPRTYGDDFVAIGTAVQDAADKLRRLKTDAPNMQVLDPLRIVQNVGSAEMSARRSTGKQ
jgi:hypothetical protein